jgi:superfamily II DNA or RNA helicase
MMKTTCEICYDDFPDSKILICGECEFRTCKTCQIKYKGPNCIGCKSEYDIKYLIKKTNRKFVNIDLRSKKTEELLEYEKKKLFHTQELIDWYKICSELREKKENNYVKIKYPDKPIKKFDGMHTSRNFKCPKNNCKGIIDLDFNRSCLICNTQICETCKEIKNENHVCDKNILKNLKNVVEECVECPKCFVNINKESGCNDMRCTNCGCYFNYTTGKISGKNSNSDYDNYMKNKNLNAKKKNNEINSDIKEKINLIKKEYVNHGMIIDSIFELYEVLNSYFLGRNGKYEKMMAEPENRNEYSRINYLLNKISEDEWKKILLSNFNNYMFKRQKMDVLMTLIEGIYHHVDQFLKEGENCLEDFIVTVSEQIVKFNDNIKKISYIHNFSRYYLIYAHQCTVDKSNESDKKICSSEECFLITEENYKINVSNLLEENKKNIQKEFKFKLLMKGTNNDPYYNFITSKNNKAIPIELHDYQKENYENIKKILECSYYALDISEMGSGKSFVSLYYFINDKSLNYAVVITMNNIVSKWRDIVKKFNINKPILIVSYTDISGVMDNQPKSGLLYRKDIPEEPRLNTILSSTNQTYNVEYYPTQLLKNIVNSGMLLIIDEYHMIKNHRNCSSIACSEIIKEIKESNNSKIIILSGTPFDSHQFAVSFFRNMKILTEERLLANRDNIITSEEFSRNFKINVKNITEFEKHKDKKWSGLKQIYDYCDTVLKFRKGFRSAIFNEIFLKIKLNNKINMEFKNINHFVYFLFIEIIIMFLSSSMSVPSKQLIGRKKKRPRLIIKNYFYEFRSNKDKENVNEAVMNIIDCFNYDEESGTIIETKKKLINKLGNSILFLMKYENGCINLLEDIIKIDLETTNKKIVVCCNFINTIEKLSNRLEKYNPIVLTGKTKKTERHNMINKFQENSNDNRLIISNFKIISVGIDLDDKFGNMPRKCYIVPNFYAIDLHQLNYRFLRSNDTKSNTEINMVYYKGNVLNKVIDSLHRKSSIIKEIASTKSESNLTFFSDIKAEYE